MNIHSVRLTVVVLAVGFGTGFQIYTTSVVNNVENILRGWINQTCINRYHAYLGHRMMSVLWASMVACAMGGACIGAGSVSMLADGFGRRCGLMISAFTTIVGSVLNLFCREAASFEMLVVGRILQGYGMGLGMGVSSLFLTEISPLRWRGACGAVVGVFFGLGGFLSIVLTIPQIIGTEKLWPMAFALPGVPAVLELLVLIFSSKESPRHLFLTRNDEVAAMESLLFYQGQEEAEVTVDQLKAERKQEVETISLCEFMFSRKYCTQLCVALAVVTASAMTGISAILSYSTSILVDAGLPLADAKFASVGIGGCNFVLSIATVFTIEHLGRRKVFLGGISGCLFALFTLTIVCIMAKNAGNAYNYGVAAALCLVLYQIAFGIHEPMVVFLTSEIFEQDVRGLASAVTNVVYFFFGGIQDLGYPPLKDAVGVRWSFLPFILVVVLCLAYLFAWLPETRGKGTVEVAESMRDSGDGK